MLAEVARRLPAALEKDTPVELPPLGPPARLLEVARRSARVQIIPLRTSAPARLQPLVATLAAISRTLHRSTDQALLFAAAEVVARLEAVLALEQLERSPDLVTKYALGWQAARLAQAAEALALRCGATPHADLPATLADALAGEESARRAWQDLAPEMR
jgi:hypothetical protein